MNNFCCKVCNKPKNPFDLTKIISFSTSGNYIITYICHSCIKKNKLSDCDIVNLCEAKLNYLDYRNIDDY
jgi:hypothetical protein